MKALSRGILHDKNVTYVGLTVSLKVYICKHQSRNCYIIRPLKWYKCVYSFTPLFLTVLQGRRDRGENADEGRNSCSVGERGRRTERFSKVSQFRSCCCSAKGLRYCMHLTSKEQSVVKVRYSVGLVAVSRPSFSHLFMGSFIVD